MIYFLLIIVITICVLGCIFCTLYKAPFFPLPICFIIYLKLYFYLFSFFILLSILFLISYPSKVSAFISILCKFNNLLSLNSFPLIIISFYCSLDSLYCYAASLFIVSRLIWVYSLLFNMMFSCTICLSYT